MIPPQTDALHPLKTLDDEPVFGELWQAQVLAMADALVAEGVFDGEAWSSALGHALKQAEADGAEDTPHTYYEAALRALETLLNSSKTVPAKLMEERCEAWKKAYQSTPHGKPVEL